MIGQLGEIVDLHGHFLLRGTPPNWGLRTALGPASLAGELAVRSTRAQHLSEKRPHHIGKRLWLFKLWTMTTGIEHGQARARDKLVVEFPALQGRDRVFTAPDDQRRPCNARQEAG